MAASGDSKMASTIAEGKALVDKGKSSQALRVLVEVSVSVSVSSPQPTD